MEIAGLLGLFFVLFFFTWKKYQILYGRKKSKFCEHNEDKGVGVEKTLRGVG